MASKPIFTDEEILYELKKLGFEEVPDNLFKSLKEELENITSDEITPSASFTSPYSNAFSTSSSTIPKDVTPSPLLRRSSSNLERKSSKIKLQNKISSNKENYLSSKKCSSDSAVIKRKTLRYVNGQAVVTEDLRVIPPKEKEEWNDDVRITKPHKNIRLSKSLSQEVCVSNKCVSANLTDNSLSTQWPSTVVSNRSSIERPLSSSRKSCEKVSLQKQWGVLLPKPNTGFNKKHDPVSRYHEYKKFWDTFKIPGENKHSQLRWAVRDKLLDYDYNFV